MRELLLLSILFAVSNSFGKPQANDIIYLTDTDSIPCQLVFGNDENNAKYIRYIDGGGSKIKKTANEILGFKTSQGEIYRSLSLEVDGQKNQYFCHVITSGYVGLYTTFVVEAGTVGFIAINGATPVEIKKEKK